MPVGRALMAVDRGIPYPKGAFAFHFKSVGLAHDIDRISAATRALSADRAIAALIRVRRVAVDAEADRAAATGAFETHRQLNLLGTLLGAREAPHATLGHCFRHPGLSPPGFLVSRRRHTLEIADKKERRAEARRQGMGLEGDNLPSPVRCTRPARRHPRSRDRALCTIENDASRNRRV